MGRGTFLRLVCTLGITTASMMTGCAGDDGPSDDSMDAAVMDAAVMDAAVDGDGPSLRTTVYVAAAGGHIEGESEQQLEVGATTSEVRAQADEGHRFTGWSDGHTTAARADTVGAGTSVYVASFAPFSGPKLTLDKSETHALTVSWPAVDGATAYTLFIAREPIDDTSDVTTLEGGQSISDATSPTRIENLELGANHYVRLVAHVDGVASTRSEPLVALPAIAGRYVPETMDGTPDVKGAFIHDVTSNLTWQRCLLGETWDGDAVSCTGNATPWQSVSQSLRPVPASMLYTLYYCADTATFGGATPYEPPAACPSASAGNLAINQEAFPTDKGVLADQRSFAFVNGDLGLAYVPYAIRIDSSTVVDLGQTSASAYLRMLK